MIFENIIKSGTFLDKNKDYTCSGGQSFNLEILNNNFFIGRSEHIYKNISYKQNLKSKRLISLLNNMQSNWNCLHRTSDLSKTFKLMNDINFQNYIESELLFILSSFYSGKIKRFDHIEYIKVDNTFFSSSENFSKQNNYLKIISSKTYSYENYAFLELFKKKFSNKELQTLENNLSEFLIKANKYRFNEIYPTTIKKLTRHLRHIIKIFLKSVNLFYLCKIIYAKIFFFKTVEDNVYSKSLHVKEIINKEKSFLKS